MDQAASVNDSECPDSSGLYKAGQRAEGMGETYTGVWVSTGLNEEAAALFFN